MPDAKPMTLDEVWVNDLFDRRMEAEMLTAYIESVWQRPLVREDKRAYTIAIDSGYGEGKTFFLKRLADHLSFQHPVAFVDAWADDIADEPLTALAATLKKALQPFIAQSETVSAKWDRVVERTSKVAWIVGKGVVRRAASLALTSVAVNEIEGLFDDASDAVKEAEKDVAKDMGKDLPQELMSVSGLSSPTSVMQERIAEFEAGTKAVEELKESLAALVEALRTEIKVEKYPPIVIIIDELDRCRPTYAVKLMEEIKHLFDVPGLVFIFGMHGEQLANSMGAAYGAKFDGPSYLRRFINRRYTMAEPSLRPLVELLFEQSGLDARFFSTTIVVDERGKQSEVEAIEAIAMYMRLYGLKARDAFGVMDILQTCSAISKGGALLTSYIVPLAISYLRGNPPGSLLDIEAEGAWNVFIPSMDDDQEDQSINPIEFARLIGQTAAYPQTEIVRLFNRNHAAARYILDVTQGNAAPAPGKYGELLRSVGRFSNPILGTMNATLAPVTSG